MQCYAYELYLYAWHAHGFRICILSMDALIRNKNMARFPALLSECIYVSVCYYINMKHMVMLDKHKHVSHKWVLCKGYKTYVHMSRKCVLWRMKHMPCIYLYMNHRRMVGIRVRISTKNITKVIANVSEKEFFSKSVNIFSKRPQMNLAQENRLHKRMPSMQTICIRTLFIIKALISFTM